MKGKHSPLVRSVVRDLSRWIGDGTLPPGRRLPTERDLSSRFHVSRAIVRAAIEALEGEGLVECRPNCRPVVTQKDRNRPDVSNSAYRYLGVWIWPDMGDYGASLTVKGIQRKICDPDLKLMIANAVGDDWKRRVASEGKFLRSIGEDPHALGAIVYLLGGSDSLPELYDLQKAKVPIVFIDRQPPEGFEADYVGTDNAGSSKQAVRRLLELGHRRIGYVANNDHVSSVKERLAGYRQALEQASIPFDSDLIFHYVTEPTDAVGDASDEVIDEIEALDDKPTALVCVNDATALCLHRALENRGYSIPADFSIVGFDGLLQWIPGGGYLTTACQAFERIGEIAAEILLSRISNGVPSTFRHVLLDAPLVDKGSIGRPRRNLLPTTTLSEEE